MFYVFFFSRFTVITQLQKMATNQALQGGGEGVRALPLHHVISDPGKPLLKQ